MMEALGDDPAVAVESLVTEDSIVKALREILLSMDADTATLKAVMQKLAVRFGMTFADLKAQWRPRIKALLPDLLELCAGGDASEAEDGRMSLRHKKKTKRRRRLIYVPAGNARNARRRSAMQLWRKVRKRTKTRMVLMKARPVKTKLSPKRMTKMMTKRKSLQ